MGDAVVSTTLRQI
jgi:hypothetical protein